MNEIRNIINSIDEDLLIAVAKYNKALLKLDILKNLMADTINKEVDEILDVEGCASYSKLEVGTIRNYVSQKKIPFVKKNGKVLFEKSKVRSWLLENTYDAI